MEHSSSSGVIDAMVSPSLFPLMHTRRPGPLSEESSPCLSKHLFLPASPHCEGKTLPTSPGCTSPPPANPALCKMWGTEAAPSPLQPMWPTHHSWPIWSSVRRKEERRGARRRWHLAKMRFLCSGSHNDRVQRQDRRNRTLFPSTTNMWPHCFTHTGPNQLQSWKAEQCSTKPSQKGPAPNSPTDMPTHGSSPVEHDWPAVHRLELLSPQTPSRLMVMPHPLPGKEGGARLVL